MLLFMTAFQFTQLRKLQCISDQDTVSDQMDSINNHKMQITAYFMFRYYIKA